MIKNKSFLTGIIIFLILVATDIYSKYLIVINSEKLYHDPITVIPGFFNIVTLRNTGAAWGMFRDNNIVLLVVAVTALVVISLFFKIITEGYPERIISVFMIFSGIVGNSIDRISRHSVVDFLDFHIGNMHWPAFNVADSAICTGAAIIIISTLLRGKKKT